MHWRILPLMMVFVALAHFNRISITVAGAEKIIPSGLISKTEMGFVYSAFLIVYTLAMLPGGWVLDRFGPRIAWMIVVFGSAFFVSVSGLAGLLLADASVLFVALLIIRGSFGLICSPLHPTAARLVANWTPPAATDLVNGLINAAALVGISFTYVLFGMLIDHFAWPGAFLIMGGFTFVVALAWFGFGADRPAHVGHDSDRAMDTATIGIVPHPSAANEPTPGFGLVIGNVSLLFLTLSYGLLGYFQYLFFYWSEYYFENQMGLSTEKSRWSSTLLTLAMAVGMFAGGWLSDRVRRRFPGRWGTIAIPMLALVLAGAATCVSLGDLPAVGVVAGLAVAMAAAGICEGSYWTTAVRLGQNLGGTAAAVMNTAGNGIGLLAPLLTPWISDRFGWQASLGLAVFVCWAAALAWLGVRLDQQAQR
ncbi:MAG: MFS transporter [Planctomycetes bacterium]|nr:MFS transporter [Planctomycetota bacterium]